MTLRHESAAALDKATPNELGAYAGPALDRLDRGFLPPEAFAPIRRLTRLSTLDVVTFKAGTRGEQVLIGHRGVQAGDWKWANKMNIAGSVILPTEMLEPLDLRMANGRPVDLGGIRISQDITTPADRIIGKEFGGSVHRVAPVGHLMSYWVEDGGDTSEHKISSWTEVALAPGHEEVIGGKFYDTESIIDNPPESLVRSHDYFIELGLLALRASS